MSKSQEPRKRDGVFKLFSRSPKPRDGAVAAPSLPPSPQPPTSTPPSSPRFDTVPDLLARTLELLTPEELRVAGTGSSSSSTSITEAVDGVYLLAVQCEREAASRRLRWKFRGRELVVRDEAARLLRWVDRFKAVGDVVANVDPLHVGLPWAGIRVLLELAMGETRRVGAAITGLGLALDMASRLRVYLGFFERLRPGEATNAFGKELVKAYVEVWRFLARAIGVLGKGSAGGRVVRALWETGELEDFGERCDGLGRWVESAAQGCFREVQNERWGEVEGWRAELETALHKLDEIRSVRASLARLEIRADLSKLAWAEGATFDSFADGQYAKCLVGTRVQLLRDIYDWPDGASSKSIFWLCGKAGIGKSTVARTVAGRFDEDGRLAASFFFKRGEGDRASSKRFFPTIARQLADRIPKLDGLVADALERDSLLCERNLDTQFSKLLLEPMCGVSDVAMSGVVVVIDALDECADESNIKTILSLLARLGTETPFGVHIFVTSRPEMPVKAGFKRVDGKLHHDVYLEQLQVPSIEADLTLYYNDRFRSIREEYQDDELLEQLPEDWPGSEVIQKLVVLASPLFIVAFTLCRYISEARPQRRLDALIGPQRSTLSGLEQTYIPILANLIARVDQRQQDETILEFRKVVGPIILLEDPLSISSLSHLLAVERAEIVGILRHLHSVLDIANDSPVRLFHSSFREFLLDSSLKHVNRFWVDEAGTHGRLFCQCLELLSRPGTLKRDVCNVKKPGTRRGEVTRERIASSIPPETAYACQYWVKHLAASNIGVCDDGPVHRFLAEHFLHWMEVMSWIGQLAGLADCVLDLRDVAEMSGDCAALAVFLDDAHRFDVRNRHVVSMAPLQLYLSATFFTPLENTVRKASVGSNGFGWLALCPQTSLNWDRGVSQLEGHRAIVHGLAFSPVDEDLVMSVSYDRTVRLWSARTCEEIRRYDVEWADEGACLFLDGETIAVPDCSDARALLRTFNFQSGEELCHKFAVNCFIHDVRSSPSNLQVLVFTEAVGLSVFQLAAGLWEQNRCGHHAGGSLSGAAITPGGDTVMALWDNGEISLWDLNTGVEETLSYERGLCTERMQQVEFSRSRTLVAAHDFRHVCVLDPATGKLLHTWQESDALSVLRLSPDDRSIAIGGPDGSVKLRALSTGLVTQEFKAHEDRIWTLAFSSNGETVASGSTDARVRLWKLKQLEQNTTSAQSDRTSPADSLPIVSITLSQNARVAVAVLSLGLLLVWDVDTGKLLRQATASSYKSDVFAISSDGRKVAFVPENKKWGGVEAIDLAVAIYEPETGGETQIVMEGLYHVRAMAFSPDGRLLVLSFRDGSVRSCDTTSHGEVRRFEGTQGCVDAVTFSTDGKSLLTGCATGTLLRRSVHDGLITHRLQLSDVSIDGVACSPDGRVVASSSEGTVRIWEIGTSRLLRKVRVESVIKHTNLPRLCLSLSANKNQSWVSNPYRISLQTTHPDISLSRQWIKYRGDDLLWLPPEYQAECADISGDVLAVGPSFGNPYFVKFNASNMVNQWWHDPPIQVGSVAP